MSKHTIPTELNIAPRGMSWLHGRLIDGNHGHPTRQSMESADRAAFEKWARFFGTWDLERDDDPNFSITGYKDITVTVAWLAWQARVALVAAPAIVQTHAEAAAALGINSALTRIRAGKHAEAIAPLEHALQSLAATPAAAAPAVLPEPAAAVTEVMGLVQDYFVTGTDEARDAIETKLRVLLTGVSAQAAQPERKYICPVRTIADLVNNLALMDQALPIYGAQYIEHPTGRRRAIAVPPTVSIERVKDSRWIGEGDALNTAIVWTRAEQPSAPQAQADALDTGTFEQRMSDWQHGDALDAARYRWLRSRDLETISQGGVFAGMTPQNVILNEKDLDQAVDTAIAAAKGE